MTDKLEQTYPVTDSARLEVSNIRGSTQVRAGQDGLIHIEALKIAGSGDESRTEIQISQESDGMVRVKTHFPDAPLGWLSGSKPCKVEYVITAPRSCSLKISGVSNDAWVEGFDGQCNLHSVSGDLEMKNLSGDLSASVVSGNMRLEAVTGTLKLNSVSGDITSKGLNGALDLHSVSGDVDLDESQLASIEASLTSGNVKAETSLAGGPYRFHSVSGDVRLTLPPDTRCTAELHSVSGGMRVNLPQTSSLHRNGRQVAEIAGGGVMVYVNSVSGGLSIQAQ